MDNGLRFYLKEYYHAWAIPFLFIKAVTDVPCHLWLQWTNVSPRMHKQSTDFRGSDFMWDPYYCFVQWQEIEQTQPGDTLEHNFIWPGWKICQRKWYRFRGQINDQPTKSITAIFQIHCPDQEEAMSLKHTELIEKEVDGVIDHANLSVTGYKLANNIDATAKGFNAEFVSGLKLRLLDTFGTTYFPPGYVQWGDVDLDQNYWHITFIKFVGAIGAGPDSQVISGVGLAYPGHIRAFMKNIGTQYVGYCYGATYRLEFA